MSDENFSHLPALRELFSLLLREPYATQRQFGGKTLEEVSNLLADSKEKGIPDGGDSSGAGVGADTNSASGSGRESFDRCLAIFHLILLDLELHNQHQFPTSTLQQFVEWEDTKKNLMLKIPLAAELAVASQRIEQLDRTSQLRLSPPVSRRLVAHLFCLSAQAEVSQIVATQLEKIWSSRETLLKKGYHTENNTLLLSEDFSNWLHELDDKHPEWTSGENTTLVGSLNTLKYLFVTESANSFHPTLMELGFALLILKFCLGPEELSHLNGGTPEELAFRLIRLQKIKTQSTNIFGDFSESHWEIFITDRNAISQILSKPELSTSREAA